MSDVERTEFQLPNDAARPEPLQRNENIAAEMQLGEHDVERSLRPKGLDEFIGQPKVKEQLSLVLTGAKNRGVVPDHVLLSGPPGLGKTTMAMIIAQEMGTSLRMTSGPALERAGDLAAMLSNLMEGDILFIDEIHRIARPAEEMLYMAMEDFRIDVIVGKGPGATSIPLEIPPFTLVGATTRAGMLTGPLRDRFGFTAQMEYYNDADLEHVVIRAARILGVDIDKDAAIEIGSRSRGTPRIANRLLRRVRDFAEVNGDGHVDMAAAQGALEVFDVDHKGLDRLDRAVLSALIKGHGGGPVGVSTLAIAVGEEPSTVEEVCEPYLVRAGMIARSARGRVATRAAWEHLGLTPPDTAAGLF
ncbi:Holliday junction branch migration DNA helicase RuvB [Corynebacterium sp.]|uniref:Holliday junction branch migration DNA helicase RuvB n=1 Tax=Corynebacterium sp. TaxID=1720 RepID=UPI002648F51E|nr:Holliday junction branch migration DNA helicase RuvB [Corynebacterium sp.]MDN6137217.1 Holliday junction branch migration DNA helicase RuvB [Corynebacterium sp.]MDN6736883.1 Holliday junction branch migration DNA helicase RuvB [Corynebacterium sp.]